MYKGFKITSLVIASVAVLTDIILILSAVPESIDNQKLTGGGRAQSEFFTMPLLFVGGSFAVVCIGLLISNSVTDIVRVYKKVDIYHRNILTYSLLLTAILLPIFGTFGLIDLMYSGWK
ncbi:MAG: hypothetical protein M9900_00445 [Flavobacteriales bacterium]|nr:hypothetical protein [Flavobacteriales bacterium]